MEEFPRSNSSSSLTSLIGPYFFGGKQNDWGTYIRELYKELEKQVKAAGAQTADHQFYAEATAQIDNVKRAWRNPSMHVDKSYSQPRAEEILLATKSLMSHLAARTSE